MQHRYGILLMLVGHLQLQAMQSSAIRQAPSLFWSLANASKKQFTPNKLKAIGQAVRERGAHVNTKPYKLLPKRSFVTTTRNLLSNNKGQPPILNAHQSWWLSPAKAMATLVGGLGLTHFSIYVYQLWNISTIETFVNHLRTDLSSASQEQIAKNIKSLEYYAKADAPDIAAKAKKLLKELRNLYINKKYDETSTENFVESIKQNPSIALEYIKQDIIFVHENSDIDIPQAITTKLIAIKNIPTAILLLNQLDRDLKRAHYTLTHEKSPYFINVAKTNIAVLSAIKNIITSD